MSKTWPTQLLIKQLGVAEYAPVFEQMQQFTETRDEQTRDQLWLVEHPPVYTQGRAGKAEHLLNTGNIPVIPVNRGGQVTYHGPGQAVIYFLLDIARRNLGVRDLVSRIENAMIAVLADFGITAVSDPDAPGVYIDGAKIGSIGLRVTQGCTYHGLSFNVDMDLSPFAGINPCGYAGLSVTQLSQLGIGKTVPQVQALLVEKLSAALEYTQTDWE